MQLFKATGNYSAYPHPKSLSLGRGTSIRLPFPHWEKGLGDEGGSTLS